MIIPQKFSLAGIEVDVIADNTLCANKRAIGEARYAAQEILIDTTAAKEDMTQQAFLHEACHYILYIMNEDELRTNEKFVDTFAQLLYQLLKTSSGDLMANKETV